MPGFNGTGPRGQGARTGGGRGYCPPGTGAYGEPVVYGVGRGGVPRGGGRGFAFGGGRRHGGRGFGRRWAAYPSQAAPQPQPVYVTAEEELAVLREQSQWMQDQLQQINQRITDLSSDQKQGQE